MSEGIPSKNRYFGRSLRPAGVGLAILLGVAALVGVFLLSAVFVGAAGARASGFSGSSQPFRPPPPPVPFSLVNLTANNTTVDVSMAFNVSVNVVNLTGGALNASNFTFAWTGLPAFVPGTPGSGCAGLNPGNNSSVLNCTAATAGALTISVTATDFSTGQSNVSSSLSMTVNVLPSLSAFTVSSTSTAAASSIQVGVNSTITFSVTATGGTAPLSFQFNGLPLGCVGNTSSLSCAPTRAGVYTVTVFAFDSYGYASASKNVTVTVTAATTTASTGIGTTGWAIVIGIVVVGALVTIALLVQARREERAGRMGTEEPKSGTPPGTGGSPPTDGSPPAGPPT